MKKLVFNLYHSNIKVAMGAIIYLKDELLASPLVKTQILGHTTEIIEGVIVFLNKLPITIALEIQLKSAELCKTLVSNFLAAFHEEADFIEKLAKMVKRLTRLVCFNEKNQQKLLI